MVRRKIRCGECGKEVSVSRTTECMGCLKRFHGSCLLKVKKRRISYRMCSTCLENNPSSQRTVLSDTGTNLERPVGIKATKLGSVNSPERSVH